MILDFILVSLTDFARLISGYLQEIWGFLMFVDIATSFIVILTDAIMLFVGVRIGKTTWGGLILRGVIRAIVIAYFSIYPPDFDLG
ncbi:MAG: hypothetical protein AM325_015560 [Candidatus Thorarchaeota archaeon SMTZ1-45]|nr:MAG: hypothetical protein AM325_16695 [Candidatus Thorarchaeota archaeon SMTZ1-45]